MVQSPGIWYKERNLSFLFQLDDDDLRQLDCV